MYLSKTSDQIIEMIKLTGFCFIKSSVQQLSDKEKSGLKELFQQWESLHIDKYLPDGGKYRYRKFSKIIISEAGNISALPQTPFFQSKEVNKLTGGISKILEPLSNEALTNTYLQAIVKNNALILNKICGNECIWEIGIHMFRVICTQNMPGSPTPGGLHKDEVDFVTVQLIGRENITGGETIIADNDRNIISRFTLKNKLDRIIIDDRKLMHAASDIYLKNIEKEIGYRDILNLDFKRLHRV